MAPTGQAFHVDWIMASSSNVHVANHRDWFTNYIPFSTEFFDAYGMSKTGTKVEGIGDVVLPVQKDSGQDSQTSQGTLTIHNVLYAPSAFCNMFTFEERFAIHFGPNGGAVRDSQTSAKLAIIDHPHLYRLRLHGQIPTQTSLDRDTMYMVNGEWPESERQRWEAYKQFLSQISSRSQKGAASRHGDQPYDNKEKGWLKQHFGSEFKFLQMYGLKIFNDDDRAEGRAIIRAFMRDDGL